MSRHTGEVSARLHAHHPQPAAQCTTPPSLACLQKLRMHFSGLLVRGSSRTATWSGCTLHTTGGAAGALLLSTAADKHDVSRLNSMPLHPCGHPLLLHTCACARPMNRHSPTPSPIPSPPALSQQLQAAALQQHLTRLLPRRAAQACYLQAATDAPGPHV